MLTTKIIPIRDVYGNLELMTLKQMTGNEFVIVTNTGYSYEMHIYFRNLIQESGFIYREYSARYCQSLLDAISHAKSYLAGGMLHFGDMTRFPSGESIPFIYWATNDAHQGSLPSGGADIKITLGILEDMDLTELILQHTGPVYNLH